MSNQQQVLFPTAAETFSTDHAMADHTTSESTATLNGANETTFVLRQLEVFNWGPFTGLHRAEFDPAGTAIIGPTGSGKTTLVDALMTLLVAQPRYNLASTGGHESDRTLISYVRGILGGDGSDGREEVARPGKSVTGICATYQAGEERLQLAGLLWTDGTSNAAQDLKRRWLFSLAEDQSLEQWLQILNEDGIRELMRMGRETSRLRIFDSKKAYLAHARKFFDVGDNAFTLLNRAAGLKQLNSIDEIFRELVLDDRTAFDRALEVASEFDNLAGIHAELETARRQQESLIPVRDEHDKLMHFQEKERRLEVLKRIVPIWFAVTGQHRWQQTIEDLTDEHHSAQRQLQQEERKEKDGKSHADTLQERYLELGGNVIGALEETIAAHRKNVDSKKRRAADYQRLARAFSLPEDLSESDLNQNKAAVAARRDETQVERDEARYETLSELSQQREKEEAAKDTEATLRKVKDRPGSNIPPKFQDFRADLADQLNLVESDLPFLAELIEVKTAELPWRGAIERALGSERLRILVPEAQLRDALKWVNDRNNRLHVRLQSAKTDDKPGKAFADGYTRKLNFKNHPLVNTAKKLLVSRDLHCVESSEALRSTEFGLTIEGMISGPKGKFEKQDQRSLLDNWMTGFDNKDQLEALARQLLRLSDCLKELAKTCKKKQKQLDALDGKLSMIEDFLELDFATIDLPGAEAELQRSQGRLNDLLDPNSDTSQAKAAYEAERIKLDEISGRISLLRESLAVFSDRLERAEIARDSAAKRVGDGLTNEETTLAKKRLPISKDIEAEQLHDLQQKAAESVDRTLRQQQEEVSKQAQRVVRRMEAALRVDTGALAETGSELTDLPDYLDRLRVLNEEALPEKLNRFQAYLNRSSDQGVTQLLSGITEEVDAIEHRIADLNQTLVKVDFRNGRYLQLQPQRIKHERLRTLENAMRKLRSAAANVDNLDSHYKALQDLVDILRDAGQNRRQQGSRALLDPRYRLQFFVVEVDRRTGDRSPPRTGSQSGSGGEKELMASHILTASLSYALCPLGANRPLYGTVVLDEAFSKSSPSAANRIIEALRIFCLHPIFVTPNKEIGLLKQHTRKVICVQRPGKEASLASISWEKLEGLVRPK